MNLIRKVYREVFYQGKTSLAAHVCELDRHYPGYLPGAYRPFIDVAPDYPFFVIVNTASIVFFFPIKLFYLLWLLSALCRNTAFE